MLIFFGVVVSLCPIIQFTFCCCLSASVCLHSCCFPLRICFQLPSTFPLYFQTSFSTKSASVFSCLSLFFFLLTFLSLCLSFLPTFCTLNPLVPVTLYYRCVLIIYQHFIVYCLPMACFPTFDIIIGAVSEDFQEKVFFHDQFLLCCW